MNYMSLSLDSALSRTVYVQKWGGGTVKGLMTSAANEFLWLLYDQPTPDVTFPSEASFDLVSWLQKDTELSGTRLFYQIKERN